MSAPHDAPIEPLGNERVPFGRPSYELTLFVTGASELSARAITSARRLCDSYLDGQYRLSVVDVHEDTAAVLDSRVRVAPTLVKSRPLPMRMVVGDLAHTDRVLRTLDLPAVESDPPTPR